MWRLYAYTHFMPGCLLFAFWLLNFNVAIGKSGFDTFKRSIFHFLVVVTWICGPCLFNPALSVHGMWKDMRKFTTWVFGDAIQRIKSKKDPVALIAAKARSQNKSLGDGDQPASFRSKNAKELRKAGDELFKWMVKHTDKGDGKGPDSAMQTKSELVSGTDPDSARRSDFPIPSAAGTAPTDGEDGVSHAGTSSKLGGQVPSDIVVEMPTVEHAAGECEVLDVDGVEAATGAWARRAFHPHCVAQSSPSAWALGVCIPGFWEFGVGYIRPGPRGSRSRTLALTRANFSGARCSSQGMGGVQCHPKRSMRCHVCACAIKPAH